MVVAVRGHLDDAQRRATLAACRLGGLEVRRLVHATTAAALVYQATRTAVSEELVAVIDFGGGGFDAALIEVGERGVEVLAQRGVEVGGDDLDARVVEWLQAEFREQAGVDGAEDPIARARMRDAAEKARVALSDAKDVTVHLPYLAADEAGPKHLQSKLTQARLEKLVADLLDRCVAALQRALDDAGRPAQQVAQVLMIGGCARMPALHGRVEAIFKKIPSATLDADEVVARGAAILAGLLASRSPEVTVQEALSRPLFLQVGAAEPTVLFARGAVVPAEHSEPVTTPGDGRPGAVCLVLEGDRSGAEPPQLLGFTVMGRPEVEVKFTLDASQVLELSVRELLRGKEARLVVEGRGGFAADVLATMVEAARAEEVERRQVREIQERRQRLEGMAQRAERVVGEQEKLNPEARAAVLAGVRDARGDRRGAGRRPPAAGVRGPAEARGDDRAGPARRGRAGLRGQDPWSSRAERAGRTWSTSRAEKVGAQVAIGSRARRAASASGSWKRSSNQMKARAERVAPRTKAQARSTCAA